MSGSSLPGLMGEYTDEELNQKVIDHAKYFTVVQITRGGFVAGGQNYQRTQVDTIEEARVMARAKFEESGRPCLIYAVADFAGANGFSRPVENYPPTTKLPSDRRREAEAAKKNTRELARQARLNMGEKKFSKAGPKATKKADGFMDDPRPMVRVSED